jgi:hypothetical protein
MIKFLNKLNFLIGLLLVVIFSFIGKFVENISRILLKFLQNIFAYFDYLGTSSGYIAMFYEKLVMEGVGTFIFCVVTICGPIFLNRKFFPNFRINWLPSIIFVTLYFAFFGILIVWLFLKGFGKLDWIDTISYLVMSIGYFGGFISAIAFAIDYSDTKHPLLERFLNKFK